MAILWQKQIAGSLYEVRQAGRSRRLYTDGIFHSQYNPRQPVTGSLWDLLLIPAFFYPPDTIRRILVLGVGGGAVMQQFQHFLKPRRIVGVELNPHHIYIARRFFCVTQENVDLHLADAVDWVNQYQGEPFDLVVDDLFGGQDREPVRAVPADTRWFQALDRVITDDGMLVTNFVSRQEFKACAYITNNSIRGRFDRAFHFFAPQYENVVAAFLKRPSTRQVLNNHLKRMPQLNPELKTSRLRFSVRRV